MKICHRAIVTISNVFGFTTNQKAAQNEREAEEEFRFHGYFWFRQWRMNIKPDNPDQRMKMTPRRACFSTLSQSRNMRL